MLLANIVEVTDGMIRAVLLPDATLSHMVKECRKFFSSFLCSKKSDKKSRFSVVQTLWQFC
jgi:hypothetical protein